MARATYTEIAEAVEAKGQKFIVVLPRDDEEGMTVYPPKTYLTDYGVDVLLMDNTANLWMDGYRIGKVKSIQNAELVADAIIAELEKVQADQIAELEA